MPPRQSNLETLPIEISEQGNCRELGILAVSVMYPEEGDTEAEAIAKSTCFDCPVATQCLAVAIKNKEHGVWGGTTERDRRNIVRTQRNRRRYGTDR